MRALRRAVEVALPIVGVALVLVAVLFFFENLYVRIAIVLLGLGLIETGIWNLASPILPSERKYMTLRTEVDSFIRLVRRLNKASLELTSDPTPQNRAKLLQVRDEMLESVKRMELYAGKSDGAPTLPASVPGGTADRSAARS